jgi:hypothetical protein
MLVPTSFSSMVRPTVFIPPCRFPRPDIPFGKKKAWQTSSSNDLRPRPPNRSCVVCRTSTSTSGVRLIGLASCPICNTALSSYTSTPAAIEAQAFSLRMPEHFFSMYCPLHSDATARAERDRLEEDIRFAAKSVRHHIQDSSFSRLPLLHSSSLTRRGGTQIANVCITLNEFPYIRYYVPANHGPLGALRPHESTRPAAARAQPENSLRWRTNLARGESSAPARRGGGGGAVARTGVRDPNDTG